MKRRRAPPFAKAAGSRPGTSLAWMHRAVSTSSVAKRPSEIIVKAELLIGPTGKIFKIRLKEMAAL
jgi:hypothetical protein